MPGMLHQTDGGRKYPPDSVWDQTCTAREQDRHNGKLNPERGKHHPGVQAAAGAEIIFNFYCDL